MELVHWVHLVGECRWQVETHVTCDQARVVHHVPRGQVPVTSGDIERGRTSCVSRSLITSSTPVVCHSLREIYHKMSAETILIINTLYRLSGYDQLKLYYCDQAHCITLPLAMSLCTPGHTISGKPSRVLSCLSGKNFIYDFMPKTGFADQFNIDAD